MKTTSIMIIDDEKVVADMMKMALEQEGYEIESFTDGAAAVKRLEQKKFDLVLTDLKMPGINGFDLIRLIRESAPETAVIMITAFATMDVAIEAKRLGVADFFTKPIRIADLKAAIQKTLAPETNA